jgi:hypothetical protein
MERIQSWMADRQMLKERFANVFERQGINVVKFKDGAATTAGLRATPGLRHCFFIRRSQNLSCSHFNA